MNQGSSQKDGVKRSLCGKGRADLRVITNSELRRLSILFQTERNFIWCLKRNENSKKKLKEYGALRDTKKEYASSEEEGIICFSFEKRRSP